jgi:TRAP-type C4-dicarboxylate transport system permease small subunit
MSFLRTLDRWLTKVESVLLVVFLSVMLTLAFTQVVLRNVFNSGLLWGDTLVRHLVLWVGFLGAAVATSGEGHISIDALTKFLPVRVKAGAHVLTSLFAAAVCWYLAEGSYHFLKSEAAAGSTFALGIPVWVGALIVPVGYLLLSFHFLVRCVESLLVAAGRTAPPRPETDVTVP